MDEQRLQDYLNLINALLNCPSGEEVEILQANPDLLDAGLMRTKETVEEMLTARRSERGQLVAKFYPATGSNHYRILLDGR